MKSIGMLSVVALLVSGWITSYGQGQEIESEVPGDHFSLEGALELFKKSESPEEFEKLLNSSDSKVNNLDLNGDGYIDYIRVFDKYEGNVHAFIIQAVVSETENQDVAVIELEKLANGKAVLQIIGDEDIYGVETIIEPTREVRTYAGTTSRPTVVNVWAWPSVQYIYGPYYAGWSSPWGYYRRPIWYHTWRPIAYYHYYPIWRPYRSYYATCYTRRVDYAHHIYSPYRTTSVFVRNRHHDQVDRYRSVRHDDDRNGRTRNTERRSYANNDRSSIDNEHQRRRGDSDLNRRSSPQRDLATSSDRSTSRKRSVPTDIQRNSREIPGINRSRSSENPNVQQRSISRERSAPVDIQRNSSGLPDRRSGAIQNNREIQQVTSPGVNRSRSSENPNVQQRSITRERSAPVDIQRNSSGAQNRRSGTIQNNREARQQATSPSVDRSRSSGSANVQQRSANRTGETRSGETKRGRH